MTFCIIGTPRSRTAWFSRFLSYGDTICLHEPSTHWSINDDLAFFRSGYGAADSMLTLKWRELLERGVRLTAVVRPRLEVERSFADAGMVFPNGAMLDRLYKTIAQLPSDVPVYDYVDLDDDALFEIFERCLELPCVPAWLDFWRDRKIEADPSEMLMAVRSNAANIQSFYHL